jgi:patatin-like phospholipase/acyl hydrolase
MNKFKILSLDGGGIRGAYSAAVLATLQSEVELPLVDYFDLIVGTSTGGIIAIGLGLGVSPEKLVEFYREKGKEIFPITGWLSGLIQKGKQLVVGTKHDADRLLKALNSVLDDKLFGDSKRPLVIVSYNASREPDGPHLFKTTREDHKKFKASMVALATSAAPLYFRTIDLPLGDNGENQTFVDGGIWANCPTLVGVTEAVRFYGKQLKDLYVLSVGTTYRPFKIKQEQKKGSLLDWAFGKDLAALVGSAQQAGTWGTTKTMLGEDHCGRVTSTKDENISLDDATRISDLIAWGKEDALEQFASIKNMFFTQAVGTGV